MRPLTLQSAALATSVFLAAAVASAQSGLSSEEILKLPMSPGSVALLVQYNSQPPVQVRLGAALRDPQAGVRAAAARIIFVSGIRGMAAAMMVALEKEASPFAAEEEIRFLVHFGSATHRPAIEGAMARLGPEVAARAALELARNEGAAVVLRLPAFRAADVSRETLANVVGIAAMADRTVFERVVRDALAASDDRLVGAALQSAIAQKLLDLPEPLLLSLLLHQTAALSIEGVWYLAQRWDGRQRWNPDVLSAMASALDAQGATPAATVELAREIVSRLRGGRPTNSAAWQALLASTTGAQRFLIERPFSSEVLSARELDAAGEKLGLSAKIIKENARRADPPKAKAPPPKNSMTVPPLEAASDYPPEFASDLFRVTGCRLAAEADRTKSDGAAGGIVTLREYGRPASLAMLETRVAQPGCVIATQLLLATSVAVPRGTAEPARERTVLVPLDDAFFACQEASHARPDLPRPVGQPGTLKPPTKIRNVPPIYPVTAQSDRVQGIVILEATISHEGCVSRARVLRGVDGRLDWAAMKSVLQWRFTPTLLDGVPVPVIMTVTVQFSLS